MPNVITEVFYGGIPIAKNIETLKNKETCPNIVVATPGRLNALVREKHIRLNEVKTFVIDECDKVLETVGKCPPHCKIVLKPILTTKYF